VSPRVWAIAAAALADVDALVTSLASSASAALLDEVGDFDGLLGARLFNGKGPAFTVSAHAAANAASYVAGSTVTVAGWFAGQQVTEVFTLAGTDGGEDFVGAQPFDKVDSIAIEAQADTSGAWTFGVVDLVSPSGVGFRRIRAATAGSVVVRFNEDDATDETIPLAAGEALEAFFSRVVSTTTIGFRVDL